MIGILDAVVMAGSALRSGLRYEVTTLLESEDLASGSFVRVLLGVRGRLRRGELIDSVGLGEEGGKGVLTVGRGGGCGLFSGSRRSPRGVEGAEMLRRRPR